MAGRGRRRPVHDVPEALLGRVQRVLHASHDRALALDIPGGLDLNFAPTPKTLWYASDRGRCGAFLHATRRNRPSVSDQSRRHCAKRSHQPHSAHPPSRQNRYSKYISVDERDTHACWSGIPMPRANPIQAFCGRSLLSGLVLATGCAHSQTDLQDRLARRVVPSATEPVPSANPVEGRTSVRPTADGRVRLAGASQPGQSTEARTGNDRTTPLPPAIAGPPRRSDSDRPSSPATSLPSDSTRQPSTRSPRTASR